MSKINYYFLNTENDQSGKNNKKILLFLLLVVAILIAAFFLSVNSVQQQKLLNRKAEELIAKSEAEFYNFKDQRDTLKNLIFKKGTIYIDRENKLKALVKERRILIIRLKEELMNQKVLKEDYENLLTKNADIKEEIVKIINETESKRMSFQALDSAIKVFKDSVKKSNYKDEQFNLGNPYYCQPILEAYIFGYDDNCKGSSTADRPEAEINCFKVTLVVKKVFTGHEEFVISIQPSIGDRLFFNLYDSGHRLIQTYSNRALIKLTEVQSYDFYLDLIKPIKNKFYPVIFYISQDIPNCEAFNYAKSFTTKF
jgi:hypothetical protein